MVEYKLCKNAPPAYSLLAHVPKLVPLHLTDFMPFPNSVVQSTSNSNFSEETYNFLIIKFQQHFAWGELFPRIVSISCRMTYTSLQYIALVWSSSEKVKMEVVK